jgi:hypothetical protein
MLKERTFNVSFVSPGHGAGMAVEEKADGVVHYTGKAVTVNCKKQDQSQRCLWTRRAVVLRI